MTQTASKLYELYQQRHKNLLGLVQNQYKLVQDLGMDTVQSDGTKHGQVLSGLTDRLKTDKLRVLVIGRFSAGKSTFVNALFGQAILPASPTPTTGVLCEVRFADDNGKKAILFPKKGMRKDGSDAPFEIRLSNLQEELGKYVKIDHFDDTQKTSRYQKLELYWPLPMLKHGIDLIDSVGLDDPDSRDEITLEYAKSADAILYCMKSQDAYSAKDKQILSMLKSLGYESIFFIITYYDHIQNSAMLGEMSEDNFKRVMRSNLISWTELKENGIHYVDSRSALIGSKEQNDAKIASSGIRDIEKALESFLVEEKGRAKLLTTQRALRTANRAVRQIIPARRSMWQTSTEELEKRYRNAELPLKNLEAKRQLMVGAVGQRIGDIGRDAYDMADGFFMSLPDKIVRWANEYEIEASVGFPPRKSTLEPVVKEVVEHLKTCIEEEAANWNRSELAPMIESSMTEVQESLEKDARDFIEKIDQIRVQISVGDQIDNDAVAKQEKPSVFGRLIAGGYGILTGDIITGGVGAFLGIKGMLRTMMYQIIAGVILGVFNLLNPVAIIIAMVAAIFVGGFHNIFSLKGSIKKTVGKNLSEEIAKKQRELSKNVENKVKEELNKIKTALDNGLAGEISSVRGEVEAILQERKKAKLNADSEIKKLDVIEKENVNLEEGIDKLMFEAGIK